MFKLFTRITLSFVLLSANPASANLKYYQYDGNLPFIDMMLNMMTVMGILEKVPVDYMHDIASSRYNNYPPVSGMQPNINVYPGVSAMQPYYANPYDRMNRRMNERGASSWLGSAHRPNDCRTMICGNRSAALNGLWMAENGEMLGVKDHQFLWNDGNQQYLTGLLQVRNGEVLTKPNGTNTTIRYQIKLNDNQMVMRDQNGLVKRFRKVRFGNSRLR